jgi:hypothetical protein
MRSCVPPCSDGGVNFVIHALGRISHHKNGAVHHLLGAKPMAVLKQLAVVFAPQRQLHLAGAKAVRFAPTLISTNKGGEAFIERRCTIIKNDSSLTGHVYRVSHGFTRFLMLNISALQSFQPWM